LKLLTDIKNTIMDVVFILLLVLALIGFIESQWPYDPTTGRPSFEYIETEYWRVKLKKNLNRILKEAP